MTENSAIDRLVKHEWEKLKEHLYVGQSNKIWSYQISPAFPSVWPPSGQGNLYCYAFAYSFAAPHAEQVAAPWARIKVDAQTSPVIEILGTSIRELGTQGIRSLSKEEADAMDFKVGIARLEEAMQQTFVSPDQKDDIRKIYCSWCKYNGVIAREIKVHHGSFFDWLMCEK